MKKKEINELWEKTEKQLKDLGEKIVVVARDIKKDAEARVFYKDIERTRDLEQAEQARLEYLEEQLEQKYERQNMYEEKAMELQ